MSRLKRFFAFLILLILLFVVLYLIFTGERINDYPDMEYFNGKTFVNENIGLVFSESGVWYETGEKLLLLELKEYSCGIMTLKRDNEIYTFTAIGKETIFDGQTYQFLIKRGAYG